METQARATESRLKVETQIIKIDPSELLLLELNARFMRHEQFARLVQNVRNDGKLTSVPFAVREDDGRYRVLSGNHRVQAAVEAGLTTIDCMVRVAVMRGWCK